MKISHSCAIRLTLLQGDRYEGFIQTLRAAVLAPNFTEHGFGLARCPEDLLAALQEGIRDGLETARYEAEVEPILGPRCKFINRADLTRRVLEELKHYAETWVGFPLIPYKAYGFRLYQNSSQLLMHVDKMQTHVISFILHIDSSEDAGTCRLGFVSCLKSLCLLIGFIHFWLQIPGQSSLKICKDVPMKSH